MACQGDLAFVSADGRFRMVIGDDQLGTIRHLCLVSHPLETGGVLIGQYNAGLDTATVTRVTGPPSDSLRKRTSFYRGIQGLQELLRALWPKEEYYLGEWHYHPGSSPEPSAEDVRRMQEIADSDQANCPEPILLVVGNGYALTAHVFPRQQGTLRLDPEVPQSLMEIMND